MKSVLEPASIIEVGGIFLIALLVFAETGLLMGLVIPGGETLIFTSGLLISTGSFKINIVLFLLLLIIFGFLGDCSGFYIGRKVGPRIYKKEDTWYFKKQYLEQARNYLEKNRKASIILGKFLPVIRPFTPLLTGITKFKTAEFLSLSFLAVVLYMTAFLLAGFFLGNEFPVLKNYLGFILPASVLLLLIPVIVQIKKNK